MFHLLQNLGCHHVKGQSQWRAEILHLQDVFCHLSRRKSSQGKSKSAIAKHYHLKANHTNLNCTSSTAFFCRNGNPRPPPTTSLLLPLLVWKPSLATACPCWGCQLSFVALSKLKVCFSHRRLKNPTKKILADLVSLGC